MRKEAVTSTGSLPDPGTILLYARGTFCLYSKGGQHRVITQDIVRKLWDEAGNGNIAVWEDGTMTLVPADYCGQTAGKKPLVILKPIALVNRFELLDFALNDEELLTKIEGTIRTAGGTVTRGPR
jgi:hypothetical protein